MLMQSFLLQGQYFPKNIEINPLNGSAYAFTTYRYLSEQVRFPSNGMYIVTEKGVVLIDTPWDTTQLQPLLDSIELRHHLPVVLCISTHFHDDRTAGLTYFKSRGIKTFASRKTDSLCWVKKEKRPQFTFHRDTVFTIGQSTIQTFYPGPGHSEDNIIVWLPNEKIIYGGCFIKSTEATTLGNLSDANVKAWKTSLEGLIKKYPNYSMVIPGHQSWKNKKSVKHTLKLVKQFLKSNSDLRKQ